MKSKSKRPKRVGRPSRARASARALAKVDLAAIDPREVLLRVAADTSAPAMARVTAAKALLVLADSKPDEPAGAADPVTALAIQLLRAKK